MNEYLIKLFRVLDERFDETDLRTLCFELGVDYGDLPGATEQDKARELVLHLEKHRRIHELVKVGRQTRPDIPWDDLIRERLEQLYGQAQATCQKERWQEVKRLCVEIERLSPDHRDVAQLKAAAETELQLAGLYTQARTAGRKKRWQEVKRLCAEIEALRPGYRDVAKLEATADAALLRQTAVEKAPVARPKPRVPRWMWVSLGLAGCVAIVAGIITSTGRQPPVLTVESHRDGDPVDYTEKMTGTYRNLSAGWHLWGIVQHPDDEYWVQAPFIPEQPDGEWWIEARFGSAGTPDIGKSFKFHLLAVQEDSDAETLLESARARDGSIQKLPKGQVYPGDSVLTLFRRNPTGHWLADFWANDAWEGNPMATQEITTTYLFQEWWAPPCDGLPETGWTARFVRRVRLPESGEYCFYRVRDDEADVFIDGDELDIPRDAEDWTYAESTCRELGAGDHDFRVDFANLAGERGVVEFWYDGPGVRPPAGPLSETWQAAFFPTTDLDGTPVWVTSLPGPFLDYRPAAGDDVPVVSFGAIFSRTLAVTETGTYRFELDLDDGARFAIDGQEVLDEWHGGPAAYAVERRLDAGAHTLRVDFYERHGSQYATLTWKEVPGPVPPVQRILFASDRDGDYDVYAMDADGANPVNLTDNAHRDYDPGWSPDGRHIVFGSTREGTPLLYVMDADGSNVTSLGVTGYQPRWSPDGSRIAFIAGAEGMQEIYVMDADGTNVVQLTNNDAADFSPDWSPDGARVVFETDRDGNQEIYVMNADGSTPVNLSQNLDAWDGTPAWSPDGRTIAFLSNRDGNDEIYLMDADGDNQRRLTNHVFQDKFPAWSPDGRYLVFEATDPTDDGNVQIHRVDALRGGRLVSLTNCSGKHERPRWSPPGYGYTFENLTDGDDVKEGALAVVGDYVWTGGNGGVMRWNRDNPGQQQRFTSEGGLAENSVGAILAESETTLWFGTGGWPFGGSGLSRYEFGEGREHWRTYTSGDGLASDTVSDLYRDSLGRVWAGTKAGARVYDGQRWTGFGQLRDEWVRCVYEASDGVFWFGLSGTGLARYDPSASGDAAWQRFDLMGLLDSGNEGYRFVLDVVEGSPGELWIATHAGVVTHDGETWQPVGGELDAWTRSAVRDVDGALWFGTTKGLVRLDADGQHTYTTADGLTGSVYALSLDDSGVLWAAGGGLSRYNREDDSWTGTYAHDDLAINYVSAILQDASGSLWFGHNIFYEEYTWDGGVSRYTPGSDDEWQHFSTGDGLSKSAVHVVYQDRDGTLWFGFDRAGGGVCRYDVDQERWHCYQADPTGLASDAVDSIVQTRDGALWFGTSGGGLSRFDRERWETFTQANGYRSRLLSDQVHCLAEDGAGALWITTDRGVNRFFYETGEWVPFTTRNSDLIADEVLAVTLDGDSGIWFGTTRGLSRYDVARRRWRNVPGTPALPDWVDNCTQSLHVDRYGTVWVGTSEGLYRSTPEGGWLRLTTANGLASNQVLAVFEDADGALWIGTPSGVSRLSVSE